MIPVVILAAGAGRRLGSLSRFYRKVLLPVGDGTLLSRHLETFSALGASRFILVNNSTAGDVAHAARAQCRALGRPLRIVPQFRRLGIGHATLTAEPFVRDEPFVLVMGDTYYTPRDLAGAMRAIRRGGRDAILSVRPVDDGRLIRRECTIRVDASGRVRKIVEKPRRLLSMMKPCGVYFFGPRMMSALHATPASSLRGEVELTDAIQKLIDQGGRVDACKTLSFDVNVTCPADVLATNMAWLRERRLRKFVDPNARLEDGVKVRDSVVMRRARIGRGAVLNRTVVFPGARVPARSELSDALMAPMVGRIGARAQIAGPAPS